MGIIEKTFGDRTTNCNEDEDEVVPFEDTDEEEEIQNEALPNYEVPSTNNINIGTFLLVTITSGKRKKTKYQYVAVVKDISNDIYHMNGLKSLDTSKLTFKVCDNDLFDVEIDEVVAVLKTPKVEKIRGHIRYVFPHEVDVFET